MAMAFDAESNVKDTSNDNQTTLSHTPSGTPSFVVVAIASRMSGFPLGKASSVTYAGTSMTKEIDATEFDRYGAIYSKALPTSGIQDVVVNWDDTFTEKAVTVATFTGGGIIDNSEVSQGKAKASTLDIGSVSGSIVWDSIMASAVTGWTGGAGQTERVDVTAGNPPDYASSTEPGASPTVTMSWAWTSFADTEFVHLAVNILVAAGGIATFPNDDLPSGGGGGTNYYTAPLTVWRPSSFTYDFGGYGLFKTSLELENQLRNVRIV